MARNVRRFSRSGLQRKEERREKRHRPKLLNAQSSARFHAVRVILVVVFAVWFWLDDLDLEVCAQQCAATS